MTTGVADGFFAVGGVPSMSSSAPQFFPELGSANFFLDSDNQDSFLSEIKTTTDDTDLFKYFLNEELHPDSSPPSSSSVGSAEGSPSASPPHLASNFSDGIPDSPSSIEPFSSPLIPNHANSPPFHSVDVHMLDANVKVKEEKQASKTNLTSSSTNTPSGSPVKDNSRKRGAPSNNVQKGKFLCSTVLFQNINVFANCLKIPSAFVISIRTYFSCCPQQR